MALDASAASAGAFSLPTREARSPKQPNLLTAGKYGLKQRIQRDNELIVRWSADSRFTEDQPVCELRAYGSRQGARPSYSSLRLPRPTWDTLKERLPNYLQAIREQQQLPAEFLGDSEFVCEVVEDPSSSASPFFLSIARMRVDDSGQTAYYDGAPYLTKQGVEALVAVVPLAEEAMAKMERLGLQQWVTEYDAVNPPPPCAARLATSLGNPAGTGVRVADYDLGGFRRAAVVRSPAAKVVVELRDSFGEGAAPQALPTLAATASATSTAPPSVPPHKVSLGPLEWASLVQLVPQVSAALLAGQESEWQLVEPGTRLRSRTYNGSMYVDVREFFVPKDAPNEWMPTKRGVTLKPDQWQSLLDHLPPIHDALAAAQAAASFAGTGLGQGQGLAPPLASSARLPSRQAAGAPLSNSGMAPAPTDAQQQPNGTPSADPLVVVPTARQPGQAVAAPAALPVTSASLEAPSGQGAAAATPQGPRATGPAAATSGPAAPTHTAGAAPAAAPGRATSVSRSAPPTRSPMAST